MLVFMSVNKDFNINYWYQPKINISVYDPFSSNTCEQFDPDSLGASSAGSTSLNCFSPLSPE